MSAAKPHHLTLAGADRPPRQRKPPRKAEVPSVAKGKICPSCGARFKAAELGDAFDHLARHLAAKTHVRPQRVRMSDEDCRRGTREEQRLRKQGLPVPPDVREAKREYDRRLSAKHRARRRGINLESAEAPERLAIGEQSYLPSPAERRLLRLTLPSPEECRKIRESARMSRDEVGRLVGATRWAVLNWELGRSVPTGERLPRYSEILRRLNRRAGAA